MTSLMSSSMPRLQAVKSALEASTGILELALAGFPGCALLHLYYLESLADMMYYHHSNDQNGDGAVDRVAIEKINSAFEAAWKSVGRGTHVNEGMIVSDIYRLHASFLLFRLSSGVDQSESHNITQQLSNLFQRWSKTPMGEGSNDEMMQDLEYFWDEACSVFLSSWHAGEEQKLKRKQDLDQEKAALWGNIDDNRRKTSSLTNVLSSYENEVDIAMSNEGIALPRGSLFPQQQDETMKDSNVTDNIAQSLKRSSSKWNSILLDDTHRFLLGLGGSETSRAFLKYASSLQRTYQDEIKKKGKAAVKLTPLEDYVATHKYSVIISLFERAVSECPTVEAVWVSYMNFLRGEWIRVRNKMQPEQEELSSALQSTSHRAIRNCPYSGTLFEIRMNVLGLTSVSNLEPDDITAVVQEATELGFLTQNREAMLNLRLVAILVVKRRLLSLVSLGTTAPAPGKDYDQGEDMGSVAGTKQKSTNGAIIYQSLDPSVMEEVQDLLEDIRDMYDEADAYLFKSHSDWSEGKVAFWKHRALTEAYVLCPLGRALRKTLHNGDEMVDNDSGAGTDKEVVRCFEKLVKAQKPSHPDSWREYIRYNVSASHSKENVQSQPDDIAATVSTVRKTRGLYQKAISSVKKAGQEMLIANPAEIKQAWMGKGVDSAMFCRDYDTALSDLCREYLEFERNCGSEESFSHAQTAVRSKLVSWTPPTAPTAAIVPRVLNQEEQHEKRKLETSNTSEDGPSVMQQDDEEEYDTQSKAKKAKVKTNLKQPKTSDGVHKVRIGKMEYPAHPFTIHVSNLDKETQDMDLVDAFRPEFGAIVHAKILREKHFGKGGHHFHGTSKCAGLIQFEERLSVEKALERNGELKVGGKLIKIQRSHLPAAGLVPSGMHRVNPKGEGKVSKRNKQKKESKMKVDTTNDGMDVDEQGGKGGQDRKNATAVTSPSNLQLGVLSFQPRAMRQKPKISLDSKKK